MAFVYRAERNADVTLNTTTALVGPGAYNLAPPPPPPKPSPAPFATTTVRDLSAGVSPSRASIPGPGTYNSAPPPASSHVSAASAFRSEAPRLAPETSTARISGPGPGAYDLGSTFSRRTFSHNPPPSQAQQSSLLSSTNEARLIFRPVTSAPSIPSRSHQLGYEEDGRGRLVPLPPDEHDETTTRDAAALTGGGGRRGVDFSKSRAPRTTVILPGETPGPGTYHHLHHTPNNNNNNNNTMEHDFSLGTGSLLRGPDSSPRSMMRHHRATSASLLHKQSSEQDEARRIAARARAAAARAVAATTLGPGSYETAKSTLRRKSFAKPLSNAGFGVSAPLAYQVDAHKQRHAPSHVKNPGPAYYPADQAGRTSIAAHVAMRSRTRSAAFASAQRRFDDAVNATSGGGGGGGGGVEEADGPGFAYADLDRDGVAMQVQKRLASRYGPFGSTSTRFAHESMAGMAREAVAATTGMSAPPPSHAAASFSSSRPSPAKLRAPPRRTSTFASTHDRFPSHKEGNDQVVIRDLLTGEVVHVRPSGPSPGQYKLPDPWAPPPPSSSSLLPRQPHGAGFLSSAPRDAAHLNLRHAGETPGVGAYSFSPITKWGGNNNNAHDNNNHRGGMMDASSATAFISQAQRFLDRPAGVPGPGNYSPQRAGEVGSLVKKSFNITYNDVLQSTRTL